VTGPLVVVHGPEALAEASEDLTRLGWQVVAGWRVGPDEVASGSLASYDDLAPVTLAALAGAGIVADVGEDRLLAEHLCDDLRRLGPVEHRSAANGWVVLTTDQRRLLDLLGEGMALGEAAGRLHLARRSADRRLAAARAALGSASTGAAVTMRRERLARLPRP
jgi:hypothetical protein